MDSLCTSMMVASVYGIWALSVREGRRSQPMTLSISSWTFSMQKEEQSTDKPGRPESALLGELCPAKGLVVNDDLIQDWEGQEATGGGVLQNRVGERNSILDSEAPSTKLSRDYVTL